MSSESIFDGVRDTKKWENHKENRKKNEEINREGERDQILRTHRFIDSGGAIAKLLVFILGP